MPLVPSGRACFGSTLLGTLAPGPRTGSPPPTGVSTHAGSLRRGWATAGPRCPVAGETASSGARGGAAGTTSAGSRTPRFRLCRKARGRGRVRRATGATPERGARQRPHVPASEAGAGRFADRLWGLGRARSRVRGPAVSGISPRSAVPRVELDAVVAASSNDCGVDKWPVTGLITRPRWFESNRRDHRSVA